MHVWATNRVGLFSVLLADEVHWCVLIRLRVFCSLSRCVSISPSVHGHHHHCVITGWYGSFHFLSQQQQWMQQHGEKKGFLFFCVRAWLDGWMTASETSQYVLSSQRNAVNELVFYRQLAWWRIWEMWGKICIPSFNTWMIFLNRKSAKWNIFSHSLQLEEVFSFPDHPFFNLSSRITWFKFFNLCLNSWTN